MRHHKFERLRGVDDSVAIQSLEDVGDESVAARMGHTFTMEI